MRWSAIIFASFGLAKQAYALHAAILFAPNLTASSPNERLAALNQALQQRLSQHGQQSSIGKRHRKLNSSLRGADEMLCELKNSVSGGIDGITSSTGTHLEHFGSCAVVSSSGVLSLHEHGNRIDAADIVMRFNSAPISGWEVHVGEKDDIRIVNERVLDEWLRGANMEMLNEHTMYVATCTVCNVGSAHTITIDDFQERQRQVLQLYPFLQLFSGDLILELALSNFFDSSYGVTSSSAGATTGAIGMALALSMCDEVVAYGMAAGANDVDIIPYSYWEGIASLEADTHTDDWHASFHSEKDLWRQVAVNPIDEIDSTDVARIPGFNHIDCTD